jgi:hypothetical protein
LPKWSFHPTRRQRLSPTHALSPLIRPPYRAQAVRPRSVTTLYRRCFLAQDPRGLGPEGCWRNRKTATTRESKSNPTYSQVVKHSQGRLCHRGTGISACDSCFGTRATTLQKSPSSMGAQTVQGAISSKSSSESFLSRTRFKTSGFAEPSKTLVAESLVRIEITRLFGWTGR